MKHNYNWGNYHTINRSISGDRRILEVEIGTYRIMDRLLKEDCSILIVIEMTLRGNFREIQNYGGQNYRTGCGDSYRDNYRNNYRQIQRQL